MAFVAFGGAAAHFTVAALAEVMGNAMVVETGHHFAAGRFIGTVAENAVNFLEFLGMDGVVENNFTLVVGKHDNIFLNRNLSFIELYRVGGCE